MVASSGVFAGVSRVKTGVFPGVFQVLKNTYLAKTGVKNT